MKRLLTLSLALVLAAPLCYAGGKNSKKKLSDGAITNKEVVNDKEIRWMSIDEVQVAMKKKPKKVWIDVYTDWCGWCKKMDKTTFLNPEVVKYINKNFYAVKLDAEQKQDIRFMGKMFKVTDPNDRTHPFAAEILKGTLSYPSYVFMEENFQTPQVIPGYQDVPTMELILKYLAEGHYRKTPFTDYQAAFKPSWSKL